MRVVVEEGMRAMWDDLKFGMRHYSDFDRIAMVGDRWWEAWLATICKPFTKARVRRHESRRCLGMVEGRRAANGAIASVEPLLLGQHHGSLDLPLGNRPILLQQPILLLGRDQAESMLLIETDGPRRCRPCANEDGACGQLS